jgi:hypothetical protein
VHREVGDCYRIDLFCVTAALGKGFIHTHSLCFFCFSSKGVVCFTACYNLLLFAWLDLGIDVTTTYDSR